MQCRLYLVSGRVQGVSFRRFTEKQALTLGLKGWVRNLFDGRVETLAIGTEDKLKLFEEAIARGPVLSRVDGIEKKSVTLDSALTDFRITEDGESPWQEKH